MSPLFSAGELLPYNDYIKERFFNFYDGLLSRIDVKYQSGGSITVAIDIIAKDASLASEAARTNVKVIVKIVHEFKIMEGRHTTIQVLSQGLNVLHKDNLVAVEFGGLDEPGTIEKVRESEAFAIGEDIRIIVGDQFIHDNQ
ncbi:hypothetical protein GC170_22810 [bacterium]|nr:hypothetical protein [bacterium]